MNGKKQYLCQKKPVGPSLNPGRTVDFLSLTIHVHVMYARSYLSHSFAMHKIHSSIYALKCTLYFAFPCFISTIAP